MKKVAVIMNTDRVGGAERSLLLQLVGQSHSEFTFMIPKVSGSKDLENLIRSYGLNTIEYYHYPENIYNLSRKTSVFRWGLLKDLMSSLFTTNDFKTVLSSDVVYINGIKAAFLFFIKNITLGYQNKVVWHFRDYWYSNKFSSFFWNLIINIDASRLHLVSNSQSTEDSLDQRIFSKYQKSVIYNPSGLESHVKASTGIKTIGFVSMLAPWKGIHEVILWTKLYEAELKKLGIEQVKFFGADLYVTAGAHVGYAKQINKLINKLQPALIQFEGHKEPSEIFNQVDCLIHYSLEAEPFGRVIIEAFKNQVPTISTALGGAAELIEPNVTGMHVYKYDKHGLFMAIEKLVMDEEFRKNIISKAYYKSTEIEKNIDFKIQEVLEEVAI